jgi:glc operon protein GlcG
MLELAGRLPLQGGLPVMNNGECLVAVGVSGGLSPQDEQVGQAGLAALKL